MTTRRCKTDNCGGGEKGRRDRAADDMRWRRGRKFGRARQNGQRGLGSIDISIRRRGHRGHSIQTQDLAATASRATSFSAPCLTNGRS